MAQKKTAAPQAPTATPTPAATERILRVHEVTSSPDQTVVEWEVLFAADVSDPTPPLAREATFVERMAVALGAAMRLHEVTGQHAINVEPVPSQTADRQYYRWDREAAEDPMLPQLLVTAAILRKVQQATGCDVWAHPWKRTTHSRSEDSRYLWATAWGCTLYAWETRPTTQPPKRAWNQAEKVTL